jgi:diguanylate cyclase (GGDEF)-like protein
MHGTAEPTLARGEPPRENAANAALANATAAESGRLEALDRYDVLDTPREEAFDRLTRLARRVLDVPIAAVSLIDGHRQWFKSCDGLSGGETKREHAFCDHAIRAAEPLIVPDALADLRFAENPYVTGDPNVRFYAGIPLRSSDGHNVGTLCVVDKKPRELDRAQLDILNDLARLAADELELRAIATRDVLTDSSSRRDFKERGAQAVALALRHHHALSVIALDIDHFKRVNDKHGHAAGDAVLIGVVAACKKLLRGSDLFGRMGGEEFAALLPHTDKTGAMAVAEKMRAGIAALRFEWGGEAFQVSASFGVAGLDRTIQDLDTLLKRADQALYEAKAAGRNRSVAYKPTEGERAQNRRRVLKGGHILFNDRKSSLDCTVRSLSDEGAGIDVYNSLGIPKRFALEIVGDGVERECRIVDQSEKHLEVEFV